MKTIKKSQILFVKNHNIRDEKFRFVSKVDSAEESISVHEGRPVEIIHV